VAFDPGATAPTGAQWTVRAFATVEVAIMAHLVEKDTLSRANSALVLAVVGGGLVACAIGAVVFDIGRAFAIW
jgi:hypothetical protein